MTQWKRFNQVSNWIGTTSLVNINVYVIRLLTAVYLKISFRQAEYGAHGRVSDSERVPNFLSGKPDNIFNTSFVQINFRRFQIIPKLQGISRLFRNFQIHKTCLVGFLRSYNRMAQSGRPCLRRCLCTLEFCWITFVILKGSLWNFTTKFSTSKGSLFPEPEI